VPPVAWVAAAVGGVLLLAALGLKHEPAIFSGAPTGPEADRAAARLVTKGSALHAALGRSGPWGAAFTDSEANAWLATDLPRNHPRLLPRGFADPRVRFHPRHVEAAVRLGSGPLSTVVWCDLEVSLRGVNQLGIAVAAASAGLLPLPTRPVLAEIARRIAAAGAATELRPLDGRIVLVVYIPGGTAAAGPRWRLESLRVDAGEAFLAGTTVAEQAAAGEPADH